MNSRTITPSLSQTHLKQALSKSFSVSHFMFIFSVEAWSTRILGSPSVWDGVWCVVISGGGGSFVTIIQTHCAQYSGVLVNIKDDTVTEARGESHDINIRMLQHHNDRSPWVSEWWRHTSIRNFYRIDINSLHFSNHYSLCERQFSFIW